MKIDANNPCPCDSGLPYKTCCMPLHRGSPAPDPLSLMRSRYSAYKLCFIKYIIETTHPENPFAKLPIAMQKKRAEEFSRSSTFKGLKIVSHDNSEKEGHVHFQATIFQGDRDCSFSENSLFKKIKGRWLYHSGEVSHAK